MTTEKTIKKKYKIKLKNVILIYLVSVILLMIITAYMSIVNHTITSLTLFSIINLIIITLPIIMTRFDWSHPLVLAIPFGFMQGISILLMSVGILPYSTDFAINISFTSGYESIYIKTILINSLGYITMFFFALDRKLY